MCMADGLHLDPAVADGKRSHLTSKSTWLHFHQGRPNKHVWLFWRQFVLPIWFNRDDELHSPLGPWLYTADNLQHQWRAYYDPRRDFLYVFQETTLYQYDRPSRECPDFSFGIETTWTPDCYSLPVDACLVNDEYQIHHALLPQLIQQDPPFQPSSFEEYLNHLPPNKKELF
jgi:hypothetical protein